MVTILVIEDDFTQRKNLVKILSEISWEYRILEAPSIEDALQIANRNDIDLFYVDVDLNGFSGLDLASEIRKIPKYKLSWIVFITTHVSYIVEAFKKTHCYDYIIKPYDKQTIIDITLTLLGEIKPSIKKEEEPEEEKYLSLDIGDMWFKILIKDIIFVEVFLRTCYVHTKSQVYKIDYTPLKNIINLLPKKIFIQCHRSYLVNLKYVQRIDKDGAKWVIKFIDYDKEVVIGKSYKKNFEELFFDDNSH